MKAKIPIWILLIGALLLVWGFVRFVIGGSEDTWICEDGRWVKHGVPSAPMPVGGCGESEETTDSSKTGLPNPASVYCQEKGGSLRFETDELGVRGICILADGTECDEWDYYYGGCPEL